MIGFLGNVLFKRTKIPEILLLIVIGILIGPVLNLVNPEDFLSISSFVSTIALIVILLNSGMEMNVKRLLKNSPTAMIFTLMVFILSIVLVSLFLHRVIQWPLSHAIILGVISGGTTTITVMTLISRLSVSEDTKNLLLMESVINDITVITGVVLLIQVVKFKVVNIQQILNLMVGGTSTAILFGFLAAVFWIFILNRYLEKHPLNYVSTLGIIFILYDLVGLVGGNGAISALVFSLTLGNFGDIITKLRIKTPLLIPENYLETLKRIETIQIGIMFFVKTFFFVFLGVIFSFKNLTYEILIISFGIISILFIARSFSTRILSIYEKKYSGKESFLISVMLPRGTTATVVSFLPMEEGIIIPGLTEIVLLLLFISTIIAIFGSVIYERPSSAKKLSMTSHSTEGSTSQNQEKQSGIKNKDF